MVIHFIAVFFCIFDQINAAFVRLRDLIDSEILNSFLHIYCFSFFWKMGCYASNSFLFIFIIVNQFKKKNVLAVYQY